MILKHQQNSESKLKLQSNNWEPERRMRIQLRLQQLVKQEELMFSWREFALFFELICLAKGSDWDYYSFSRNFIYDLPRNVTPFVVFDKHWTVRVNTRRFGSDFITFFATDEDRWESLELCHAINWSCK